MAITRTGFNPEFCEYDDAFYKQFLGDRHLKRRMQGYMPPDEIINYKTEKKLRAFRFGIFGILGQDARLEGYQENNLAKLLSCEESLRFVAGKVRANLDLGVDTKKAIRVFNNPNGYLYSRSALEHAMNGNALNFIKY
jgi:ATP-dependent exoDNAse (exonuclease V) alpha subunit